MLDRNLGSKVKNIFIKGLQDSEVMEQLSACTRNVKQLIISSTCSCIDWLTADVLTNWNLTHIVIKETDLTNSLVSFIVQTCTELITIELYFNTVDAAAVIAIAQHCSKLETLVFMSRYITWISLLALSEWGLPLEELHISYIPNIPSADIARRCSHALSCIRTLKTVKSYIREHNVIILIPYMTGLTSVDLDYYCDSYIPLLTQHCHKLTKIVVYNYDYSVEDILSLCRASPLLQELTSYVQCSITDDILIELIHACPHLHTLCLSYETDITDIGILALSEHCPQFQKLELSENVLIAETSILQLLQRCHKLTILNVSSNSLSEETWTQLDSNTQKKVRRCEY